jgi:hypothetical protein
MLGHFLRDLEEIRGHHCTYVVHTFNENDQAFYRETMREFVQATRDAGLKTWVDPWGVGRVFGGEAFSNFTSTNPDAVQIAERTRFIWVRMCSSGTSPTSICRLGWAGAPARGRARASTAGHTGMSCTRASRSRAR